MSKRRKRRKILSSSTAQPKRDRGYLQSALERAERLVTRGRPQEAIELLKPLVDVYPREADLYYYLGYASAHAGDLWEAMAGYERAMKLGRDPAYWAPLASLYLEAELNVHALRAFRQTLKLQDEFPIPFKIPEVVQALEQDVGGMGRSMGVSAQRAEEGCYHMERGLRALHGNDFPASIAASRQAVKLLRDWPPPHNNLSQALFWNGQPEEAIATARRVLSRDPDNIHALGNAIRFLAWTGREAEARELWPRLQAISSQEYDHQCKIVEVATILDEDETVYRLLRAMEKDKSGVELTIHEQICLAVAEANTGRRRQAQRRLKALQSIGPWVSALLAALKAGKPGPGWAERFPYYHSSELLPSAELDKFIALAQRQDDLPPQRFRSQMERFVARFPQIVRMAEKIIWEDEHPEAGLAILQAVATPAACAATRRFGLSQAGDDDARMGALQRLAEAGEIEQDELLQVWIRGEWREVLLRQQEISDEPDSEYSEEVAVLLNRGLEVFKRGEHEEAERLFLRALELEPRAKEAYNNLAALYTQRGEHERGRELLRKALEIDPLYVFPRCNLAIYLLNEGDVEEAEAMLRPLAEVTRFHPQALAFYYYAQAQIQIHHEEYETARNTLQAALEIYPDYEPAENLLERLDRIEFFDTRWGAFREQQHERDLAKRARLQAKLTVPAPSLSKALSLYTKNVLVAMGRVVLPWGGWSGLRKAELVREIIEGLTDADNLECLAADLSDEEQDALRQVLASGGTMSWQNFDERYGSDLEESPYWQWHTPETSMGRLRLRGLLVETTVGGELLVAVPSELRQPLRKILA